MLLHGLVRAHFDRGEVVHIERRIAGLAWPHEQGHFVAPGHKGPLKQTTFRAPFGHERREGIGLPCLEGNPAVHVHAAQHKGGVHAVVNIGFFDVGVKLGTCTAKQITIARGIDHHLGHDRHAAFLALEHHAFDGAVFHDGQGGPRVVDQFDATFQDDLLTQQLQALRVHGG